MCYVKKDSTIVVTGGNGFLGQAVIRQLHDQEYSNVQTFHSHDFDLTSQGETRSMFAYYYPEVVIHLAAKVGGIGANMRNPGKFAYENLIMGLNVLEEARKRGTPKVIMAATTCAYPKFSPVPFREDDIWNGFPSNFPEETNAPYGLAKRMLLVVSQAYRQQYCCNFVILFPTNLFGPMDSFDLENSHVIPAMLRKFHEAKIANAEDVVLWGDGSPTREFLYVEDCAKAFVAAMELYDGPEPINVGTGKEIPMRDLAETIRGIVQYNGRVTWDASKPNGQPRRCLDVTRAKERLGWEATTDFKEGLKMTYEWYLHNR
jgi:GDP-L-fucose synthase